MAARGRWDMGARGRGHTPGSSRRVVAVAFLSLPAPCDASRRHVQPARDGARSEAERAAGTTTGCSRGRFARCHDTGQGCRLSVSAWGGSTYGDAGQGSRLTVWSLSDVRGGGAPSLTNYQPPVYFRGKGRHFQKSRRVAAAPAGAADAPHRSRENQKPVSTQARGMSDWDIGLEMVSACQHGRFRRERMARRVAPSAFISDGTEN